MALEFDTIRASILPYFGRKLNERLGENWQFDLRKEGTEQEPRFVLYAQRPMGLPFYFRRLNKELLFGMGDDATIDYLVAQFEELEKDIVSGAIPFAPKYVEKK